MIVSITGDIIEKLMSAFSFPKARNEIDSALADLIYRIVGKFRLSTRKQRLSDDIDYQKFRQQLLTDSESIPRNLRLPLNPHVASAALDSAKLSIDSPKITMLYSRLITSSQNSANADYNHIAFVEIIRQLAPYDIDLLQGISCTKQVPACVLRRADDPEYMKLMASAKDLFGDDNSFGFDQNLMPNGKSISQDYILLDGIVLTDIRTAISLGNLSRLGLISVDYSSGSYPEHFYDQFLDCPEIRDLMNSSTDSNPIAPVLGTCELTAFGSGFVKVCLGEK